ncbi:heat shock factor protein 2-like isoform X3 [Struthio camelus]|uniref:heat shock factor protein 2-like isoform X3 n=1 Tax=Struthio camelus TaxID=8801 RepID=UPI003603C3A0
MSAFLASSPFTSFLPSLAALYPAVRPRVYGAGGQRGAVTCGGAGGGRVMQPADGGGGGGGGAVVPQFLSKIWALVEDPQTNEFICWSADGQSFKVLDEESFAKKILPKHFKHNNMASFVRQLNSYGFHKVMQYESGSTKQERCGSGKYQHPFFRKGQEELLSKIKRKVSLPRIENDKIDPEELHKMLAIIHQMQGKQDMIDSTLESLKRENKALWKEVLHLKRNQIQHHQLCEANVASQCYSQTMGLPQKQPPMIDSTGDYNQQSAQELVDQSQTLENQCDRTGSRNKSEVRVSDLAGDQLKVQADASPMWTRMAEEIHPSNADWVLEHRNRSCENQEHLHWVEDLNDDYRNGRNRNLLFVMSMKKVTLISTLP